MPTHATGPKRPNMRLFRYDPHGSSQTTVRKHLLRWGASQGMALKCDIPGCGCSDGLEMHHVNGVNKDNRLKNLQMLCKACHVNTPNHGTKNVGMVDQQSGGFSILRRDGSGKRDYTLPAEFFAVAVETT